jgi:DNA replication protein DnaC
MNKKEPLIYLQDKRVSKIKLTAADLKYPVPPRIKDVLKQEQKIVQVMPTIQQAPELYYACSKCGVIPPQWFLKKWYKRSCPCKAEERAQQERQEKLHAWLEWQRINCYGGWLGREHRDMNIVSQMISKTFNSFSTDSGDDENFRKALAYAQAEKPQGNFVLTGGYGTGKTHLGDAILNYRREHFHNTTLFASAPEFCGSYQDAKRSLDQTQFISIRQRVVQADILYLDDIDKEWRGEYKQPELHSIYYYIFDERYKARRPTIVSTNDLQNLEKYIGGAAKSRLMSLCTTVHMLGEDFRAMEVW